MSASRRRSIVSPGKPGMSTKRPPPERARTPRTRPGLPRSWLLQFAVPLVRFSQPNSMSTVSVVARSRALPQRTPSRTPSRATRRSAPSPPSSESGPAPPMTVSLPAPP